MEESLEDIIIARRFIWWWWMITHCWRRCSLGLNQLMERSCYPQSGTLPLLCLHMRWRDRVRKYMAGEQLEESSCRGWHKREVPGGRVVVWGWRMPLRVDSQIIYHANIQEGEAITSRPFKCDTCQSTFRCGRDIAWHRCVTTWPRGQMTSPPIYSSQPLFNLSLHGRRVSPIRVWIVELTTIST